MFQALKSGLDCPVYDPLPPQQEKENIVPFPYAVMGKMTGKKEGTKTSNGDTVTQIIEVYSDFPGKKETMEIGMEIESALSREHFSVEEANAWDIEIKSIEIDEIDNIYFMQLEVVIKIDWSDE